MKIKEVVDEFNCQSEQLRITYEISNGNKDLNKNHLAELKRGVLLPPYSRTLGTIGKTPQFLL